LREIWLAELFDAGVAVAVTVEAVELGESAVEVAGGCEVKMTVVLIAEVLAKFIVDPRQWLYDHKLVVVGVWSKHDTLPSISHRDARSRMVA
jgi:hypothetical protein